MLTRPPRRSSWRSSRSFGLRRARVDAFRVYAMLFVIIAHTETALGPSQNPTISTLQLVLNVLGRSAVPLFLLFAGEQLGPRLLGDRVKGAVWPYVRRLGGMFLLASLLYWLFDLAKLVRGRGIGAGVAEFLARQSEDPMRLLLYGARQHLWFLVVLMLVVIFASLVLARARVRVFVTGAAVVYGIGLAIGPYGNEFGVPPQHWWSEWLLQSPLFFGLGVVFALEGGAKSRVNGALLLILAGIVLHTLEVEWITTQHGTSPFRLAMLIGTVFYAAGAGLLALSPGASSFERLIARAGPYVPAVYLNHMVFVELLRPPRGRFPEVAARILLPLLTAICAWSAAWLVGRIWPKLRRRRHRPATAEPDGELKPVASPEGP